MTDRESGARETPPAMPPASWPTIVTWRFRGDRTVADQAYAARFNVTTPPAPTMLPDGSWAYPLPDQNV